MRAMALALVLAAGAEAGSVAFHRLDLRGLAINGVFSDDLDGDGHPDLIALGAGQITVLRAKPARSPIYPGMAGYFELTSAEVRDWRKLCASLLADTPQAARIRENLDPATRQLLSKAAQAPSVVKANQQRILKGINVALAGKVLAKSTLDGLGAGPLRYDHVLAANRRAIEGVCGVAVVRLAPPERLATGPWGYFADTADVSPAAGREIVVLTPTGVVCFEQKDGRFVPTATPVVRCETVLSMTTLRGGISAALSSATPVLPWNFALDASGDGRDDLLVPQDKGTDVYVQREGGKFEKVSRVGIFPIVQHYAPAEHRPDELRAQAMRPVNLRVGIPRIECRDVNGDGRRDMVCGQFWHAQRPDGTFDPVPSQLPADQAAPSEGPTRLMDVDGDGKKDRLGEENAMDDPLNIVTRVRVFLADAAGRIPPSPTQVIVGQNTLIHTHLPVHDFNGDGALDFAMFKTDITPTMIAKWVRMSLGKIEGNLNFYLFDRQRRGYSRRPTFTKSIRMRFKIDLMEAMMGLVWERYLGTMMRFEGDFNADRRLDLLVRQETNAIALYFNTGDRRRIYASEPDVLLEDTPAFYGLALSDLNGDGADDLLLYAGRADNVVAAYISQRQ